MIADISAGLQQGQIPDNARSGRYVFLRLTGWQISWLKPPLMIVILECVACYLKPSSVNKCCQMSLTACPAFEPVLYSKTV